MVRALKEFRGKLYAATASNFGGQIYRSDSAERATWERVVDRSFRAFGERLPHPFRSLVNWRGKLFAGTGWVAQVWQSGDGMQWRKVAGNGFGKGARNFSVRALEAFDGALYAGTGVEFTGSAAVCRSHDGNVWESVVEDGFGGSGDNIVYALAVYDSQLYAGTFNLLRGAGLYRTRDGESWEPVISPGFGDRRNRYIYDLRVYQPTASTPVWLVATTGGNFGGGQVWIYDGKQWSALAHGGFGKWRNCEIWAASQFEDNFYVGTWKCPWGFTNDRGAELWRFDHRTEQWEPETTNGFGNPLNAGIRVLFPWRGALYATLRNTVTGAELWKGVKQ